MKVRPAKYNNQKVTVFGITFDSKKEAERYLVLRQWEREGKIYGLERQKEYILTPTVKVPGKGTLQACKYVADFVYHKADGELVVEDVKGYRTKEYIIKKKMMYKEYQIWIDEV